MPTFHVAFRAGAGLIDHIAAPVEMARGAVMGTGVVEDPTGDRFVVASGDGEDAELVYHREAGHLYLVHTGVPTALGGRGIGGELVRAAIAVARRDDLVVVPWCPFARRWLREHAEEAMGVVIDWASRPPRVG